MIIEDKEMVSSTMDGSPWEAGKFSLSLRLSLWAEHLGLHAGEVWTLSSVNLITK
jgi:phospholipase D1/2